MTGPVIKALMISGVVMAFVPGASAGEQLSQKKGTTPYVTHFVFRPVQNIEVPGLGTAHLIEAVGTTQNMNGEKMLDKMAARCSALNVQSGKKKYIDGACTLTDKDGDIIFSTSIRAMWTNLSPDMIVALTSLQAGQVNIQA